MTYGQKIDDHLSHQICKLDLFANFSAGLGLNNNNNTSSPSSDQKKQEQEKESLGDPQGHKYVPPHLRNKMAAAPQDAGGWNATVTPSPYAPSYRNAPPPSSVPRPGPFQARGTGVGSRSSGAERPSDKQLEQELFSDSKISTGINFDKYDDIPVSATGNDIPPLIDSFESANFHDLLKNVFRLAQYTKPTPIQKYAFSIVEAGRDLMACAQTGSGKTGAFLIPIISKILTKGQSLEVPSSFQPQRKPVAKPKALILAPTRELAQQIFNEARKFTYRSWIKPCAIYGGEDPITQLRQMERGCDLLVATPGRLTDMIERGRISLSSVDFLVLDEADRMLDMGFEPQIRRIVTGTDMPGLGQRTTLMFSATFPKNIQNLAREFLSNYIFVTVGKVGASSENIKQHIEYVSEADKRSILVDILKNEAQGLVLIFTETKRNADVLDHFLYNHGLACCSIHGDKTQAQRTEAIQFFKSGRAPILVATSVASRGLDIPNVTHVINYELPGDMDDYVHRIGRTGRAGNVGKATTFFTDANRGSAGDLIKILDDANQEVPSWLRTMAATSSSSFGGSQRSGKYQSRGGGSSGYSTGSSSGYGRNRFYGTNSGSSQGEYSGNGNCYSSWD